MNFISNAAASITNRVVPAIANAAIAHPLTAVILTGGTVGLAALKGAEVAVRSAPLMRSFKNTVHSWSAPEAVKRAAKVAADKVQAAADLAEAQTAAATAAAKIQAAAAEAATAIILPPTIHANGLAA